VCACPAANANGWVWRVSLGQPRLVVLDEPSAHLDVEGRRGLVAALGHLRQSAAAVVVVTHDAALARV
jgi:ATP-binding cassette subfamily C protein